MEPKGKLNDREPVSYTHLAPQQEMHETTGITSVPEEMPDHGPTMTL